MTKTELEKASQSLFEILNVAKSVAIFSHVNPDPDAYGSAFACRQMCRNMGKSAEVFAVKNANSYLDKIFPLKELKTDFKAEDFDAVVIVDVNMLSRIDKIFVDEIQKSKTIIVFDHHLHDVTISKNELVDFGQAACCQLLTHFMIDHNLEVTPEIATFLWAGLMGDTDRFLHSNLSHDVLQIATYLFDAGANVQFVYDQMYRTNSVKDILLQKVFVDKTIFNADKTAGCTIFTKKDIAKLGIDQEMIKKYTNSIINLNGVKASFLCIEYDKNLFKISIRTKGLNCQYFAKEMGGGGHVCASGFNFEGTCKQLKIASKKWASKIMEYKIGM